MLTPNYIQQLTEGAEEIASELHRDIISRIVERIMTRIGRGDSYILTATDKWQLEVLQDAGFLLEDLQREISQKTKVQLKEMKAAFEDAGIQTLAYDHTIYEAAGLSPAPLLQSPNLVRLLQRGYEATAQEWENFTRTTANAAQQLYIRECDRAYHLVSSGLLSYQQAAREAVERIAKDGVTVTYPSGHTDTIETATLRALRTGVSQACGEITDVRMEEMGWDIVLTSAHLGARVTDREDFTNHYWWQGKFYSRSGKDKRFPPFSVCGMGDVQGIHGANCRHSHGPGDGVHNPYEKFDSEENRKAYELSQRQRTLERRIRKTKREVQALQTALENAPADCKPELQAAYQKKAALLTKQNKAYNDFCEENDLKRLPDRLSIAGWDRRQAAKARDAAREKAVANSAKSGIIYTEGESMGMDLEIDTFTPCLVDRKTGAVVDTSYSLASAEERKGLKKQGWLFNWNHKSLENSQVYKLTVKGDSEIQGLVAMEDQPRNYAVHLSLAESAPYNKGDGKSYNGVGGHLFAIATKRSLDLGYGGFIFFEAKNTKLVKHYSEKFGAQLIGRPHQYSMIIDEEAASRLLETYTL